MNVILLINEYGNEVPVNREVYQQLVGSGKDHLFQRQIIRHDGFGDPKKILLDLRMNGIGDDIQAMPAIFAKREQGFDITVIGRYFSRACYESLGCHFINEEYIQNAKIIEPAKNDYGVIYSLKMWTHEHEWDTNGECTIGPMEQFARMIEVELPQSFDWVTYLSLPNTAIKQTNIIFALKSSSAERSYPKIAELQKKFPDCDFAGVSRHYSTFREMVSAFIAANGIVGVDSGLLVLGLALGKRCVAIVSDTSLKKLFIQQFAKFRDISNVSGIRPEDATPEKIFNEFFTIPGM